MTRLQACLLLRLIPGIGNIRAKKLITHCCTAENIFSAEGQSLLSIEGIGQVQLRALKNWKKWLSQVKEEMVFIEKQHIQCLFYGTPAYPITLAFCPDAPAVLFYKGRIHFPDRRLISIVGTRQNTPYGRDFCEQFIEEIRSINPIIVSGFAYGIDIIAHRAALKNGLETVACLAHGLDKIYPTAHKKYMQAMENSGGFVTDFMRHEAFDRNNFPRRNRIIAGLSHVTVVIETAHKGGSMNTADLANQYGREIFALPGRVNDKKSQGCHQLIVQNKAQLLTSPSDFLQQMGWMDRPPTTAIQKQLFVQLSKEEKSLYHLLKDKEQESLDILALQGQLSISRTASLLMQLEMKGLVRPLPGKYFQWI